MLMALEVNGKYDLRAGFSLSTAPCHLHAVSYVTALLSQYGHRPCLLKTSII
jgi:hypothetical protein